MAKQVRAQAQDENGVLVFDETMTGKKHKQEIARRACQAIDSGVVRFQVVGTPNWAYVRVLPGVKHHEIDPRFRELWANGG